jgi:hypothetical protein
MKRTLAISLLALGVLIGLLGLVVLPPSPGRLVNAIQIMDPRPLTEAAMPEGLRALGAMPASAVGLPPGPGPKNALLVPRLAKLVSSADTELGKIPERASSNASLVAVAGADTDLHLGATTVKGIKVQVAATLHPLGPMFDENLIMADTPEARAALGVQGRAFATSGGPRALYLLLTESYKESRRMVARIEANPSLLPAPHATVYTMAYPPPLSDSFTLALAAGLICAGIAVIALQLRGLTRDEINHRFARK